MLLYVIIYISYFVVSYHIVSLLFCVASYVMLLFFFCCTSLFYFICSHCTASCINALYSNILNAKIFIRASILFLFFLVRSPNTTVHSESRCWWFCSILFDISFLSAHETHSTCVTVWCNNLAFSFLHFILSFNYVNCLAKLSTNTSVCDLEWVWKGIGVQIRGLRVWIYRIYGKRHSVDTQIGASFPTFIVCCHFVVVLLHLSVCFCVPFSSTCPIWCWFSLFVSFCLAVFVPLVLSSTFLCISFNTALLLT